MSVHTRKVIVAALTKNLPYEIKEVVPVVPGSPPPDWRQLSPTGLIPAIRDGGVELADSSAICAYLERCHPGPSLYPASAAAYARALWFEQYAGGTLFREVVRPLFHEVFVQPRVRQQPTDAAHVDAVLTQALPEVFGYLEGAAGEDHLAGADCSIGDIAVASNLVTFQYIGFALDAARFPRLARWFARVLQQPALREALRREQPAVRAMGLNDDWLAGLPA
ncbi:MAG: glutathione S-transferase family protein [Piscinibacter sp.]|nr:glutathione S-transferase family protein [Piscinibacter sp.]